MTALNHTATTSSHWLGKLVAVLVSWTIVVLAEVFLDGAW